MPTEIGPAFGLREPISSATHVVAFIWSIYATLLLIRLCRGDLAKQLSLGVFGASMTTLYAISSSYHGVWGTGERLRFFQLLDHSAIYGLIAGTYTPAFVVLLRPSLRKNLLLVGMWLFTGMGIACKWLLPMTPYGVTVALYFGLGFGGMLPVRQFLSVAGLRGMCWAWAGGAFYIVGGLVDLMEWPAFYPGVFGAPVDSSHLFTMAGTACHFTFMMLYVVPFQGHEDQARGPIHEGTKEPTFAFAEGRWH